jgi:hypothetical protein
MTIEDLAKQALGVLELQQEYFRTRSTAKLAECRDAERKLREACLAIVKPPGPSLFDGCAKG